MTIRTTRKIVHIDEEKCTGCGVCIPSCAEGALQIIDGKAKLISEKFCDGLGACLGECPEGAITIEERAADDFDQELVKEHLTSQQQVEETLPCGCPGSTVTRFEKPAITETVTETGPSQPSMLGHWPVQMTLGRRFFRGPTWYWQRTACRLPMPAFIRISSRTTAC